MAVDHFLKLNGVPGESKDHKYADHIEVLSFSWGATQQGGYHTGTGGGTGKVNVHDISFTHHLDKSSSVLWQRCMDGKAIPDGMFIARKAGAQGKQMEYLKLKFEDLIVSSVNFSGNEGADNRPLESFSLNFKKVTITYITQDNKGASSPNTDVVFNAQENTVT
jgi:type VI secretion system secreted protein Hcp